MNWECDTCFDVCPDNCPDCGESESHSFPNTDKTVWSRPRSQGKSFLAEAAQRLAREKAKQIERDIVMAEAEGGLFVPREHQKEICDMSNSHINDWSYPKYKLNRKVLVI